MKNKRLLGAVRRLSEGQLDTLADLLEGDAVLLYIHGVGYAVDPWVGGFRLRCIEDESYYVVGLEGCTCPDSRYRGHRCKHMDAVHNIVTVGTP